MQPLDPNTSGWTCICVKYGYGLPHKVLKTTWYRHLDQASSDEEKRKICSTQANHDVWAIIQTIPAWRELADMGSVVSASKRTLDGPDQTDGLSRKRQRNDTIQSEVCCALVLDLSSES
jgi:hypothetical protein